MTTKENIKAMVLYTDGGCRPNPGYAGCGIHGYTFEVQKSVRGIGHLTHAATARGYDFKNKTNQTKISKEEWEAYCALDRVGQIEFIEKLIANNERVTVNEYYDISYAPEGNQNTNNTAELIAATKAVMVAIEKNIAVLVLRIDSMLVINGITTWVDSWKQNNWKSKSGGDVSSVHLWEEFLVVRDQFRAMGSVMHVEWVKGHGDDIGNNSADSLATTSVYANQCGQGMNKTIITDGASGYWGSAIDNRHPMLSHRFAYFIGNDHYRNNQTYYLGSQGKEADMIAKKSSEAGYAVVNIDGNDPMLSMIINKQCDMPNELQSMYLLDIDAVYGHSYRYLSVYRDEYLFKRLNHRFDLWTPDDTPITRELNPPVIAMRAIDSLILFSRVLNDFLNNTGTKPVGTDITDLIYEKSVSVDKKGVQSTENKIRADFVVGQSSLDAKAQVDGIAEPVDITLTTGIDIADRNMFKRLEHLNPKVHLITWGNDPLSFHYATVVQADGCRGIWGGPFSNIRVLSVPRVL